MTTPTVAAVEDRIREIGLRMFDVASKYKRGYSKGDIDARLMDWAMRDEELKVRLFRFVDVLPMLNSSSDVMKHLQEYLGDAGDSIPAIGQLGLKMASSSGLAGLAVAATLKKQITGMARNFIAGSNVREASEIVERLRTQNMAFTMDVLGEVTVSEVEGERYQQQYLELIDGMTRQARSWAHAPLLDIVVGKPLPRVNLSIKLSALTSQIEPADPAASTEKVKARLRPILDCAKERGASVLIDMESYAIKDLTLRIFREIIMDPAYRDWEHIGIVLQAYLRDCEQDAQELAALARERGTPITVRLVKGAYWDYETIMAGQRHWPIPVWTGKHETDSCFERVADMLLREYPAINLAVASHNVRSISYAIARAESLGLPGDAIEFQMLYGMGDQLKQAVLDQGKRLRIYTPFGELIPGMAYLVRRLLENTANESFLRQGFAENVESATLLRNPADVGAASQPTFKQKQPAFSNVPERDFSRAEHRTIMQKALDSVRSKLGASYPLIIDGKRVATHKEIVSVDPARPPETIGRVASASREDAAQAIEAAKRALPKWRGTPPDQRAAILHAAAKIMEQERDDLSAWQVYEVGKNWREADADVCETIDYLHYYADEMVRLGKANRLGPIPGETNDYFYEPKGIVAVISPWNFPMAICAGMTTAAVVTGNTTVVKPASQSPVIAAKFVEIMHRAGLPSGVINFIPGSGAEIGDYIVQHPDIHMIVFTGSREIGCRINKLAADVAPGQKHLKKVIAEMGGKNAIIVDGDADLDEAVIGTVQAAFGYQGQKCSACSRVIVLESCYDQFLERVVEAVRSLTIGFPEDPENFMGPVVDDKARKSIHHYIEIGKQEARLMVERDVTHLGEGYFVSPTVFGDVPPTSTIAQEEIFGPVLSVIKARDLDHALEIALGTDFSLTGGIFSRSPKVIDRIRSEYRVGNLYINRKITGAIVARQPFGGFNMSGIGSKAGGPDYLMQFMDPRTITENTMRRGFAPSE